MALHRDSIIMPKWKVVWPKKSHNTTEGQSGVNLTSTTMSSDLHELESSGIRDRDATSNLPPVGGRLEAGAQESPSISDIELEDVVLPPDKGKGKAMPDNTAQGGSGHDPPIHQETTYCLQRWNKSADCLRSHSVHCCLTTRSDNEVGFNLCVAPFPNICVPNFKLEDLHQSCLEWSKGPRVGGLEVLDSRGFNIWTSKCYRGLQLSNGRLVPMYDGRAEAWTRESEYWNGAIYQKQKDKDWDRDMKMRMECKRTKIE